VGTPRPTGAGDLFGRAGVIRCFTARVAASGERREDRRGISQLTVARSTDGVSNWVLDPAPLHGPWNPAGGHVHGPCGPTGVYAITQQSSSYPDWLLPDLRNGPFRNGPRWPGARGLV
jgi:hypothetical protein